MEVWADIPGYEGRYKVSNLGRIAGQRGVLKPQKINSGYYVVHLCVNRDRKARTVHRLVALAFVPGYSDGAEVNHLDSNRANNAAPDLEWVDRRGNMQHAKAAGRMRTKKHAVIGAPIAGGEEVRFARQSAAEKALTGRNSSAVHHCITGRKKSAYGYFWRREC